MMRQILRTLSFRKSLPLRIFAFTEDIRRIIYTTNVIELLNMILRKVTRNHRIFPSDEAVYKVYYLEMLKISKKWTLRGYKRNRQSYKS